MALMHVVIDGYNFLHASAQSDHDWMHLPLEDARAAMLGFLAVRRRPRREKITVVFDGSGRVQGGLRADNLHGIEVVFSEPGVTADEVICSMIAAAPNPRAFLVVTADRAIRTAVLMHGAKVIAPLTFLVSSEEHDDERRRRSAKEPPEKFKGTRRGEVERWKKIFGFDDDTDE